MTERIVIDPVTRVEGHARITIVLGDDGAVQDARFHVTEFRGFERFCEGRSFREMPLLTSRVCGICPVSHQLASAKACDALLAVEIPEPARKLRRLLNHAQLLQSHALSLFHLSGPDLVLGMDCPPARRNLAGLLELAPEVARDGIRLRQLGQTVIEVLGGKRIHAPYVTAGGVARPLPVEGRDQLLRLLPDGFAIVTRTLDRFRRALERHREEEAACGELPTAFLALVGEDGSLEHYDGKLRFVSATGEVLADAVPPASYSAYIGEAVEPWSYMKFPYFRPLGYPAGAYRVGPLARLNVARRCGTPRADAELAVYRQGRAGPILSTFRQHHARLVELVHALERMEQLLADPEITSADVQAAARRNRLRGVGVIEAPRGTLFHDYEVKPGGLLTRVNLLVATGQNNLAMNATIRALARRFVHGGALEESMLNRVEAGIRAFDPCLSCATHAAGALPLRVELRDAAGGLLDVLERP